MDLSDPLRLVLYRKEKAQQISCYRAGNGNGEIVSGGAKREVWICIYPSVTMERVTLVLGKVQAWLEGWERAKSGGLEVRRGRSVGFTGNGKKIC